MIIKTVYATKSSNINSWLLCHKMLIQRNKLTYMAKKKELLIVGTIPDTAGIGGVSIHVKRLMDFLDIRRIKYKFVDYKINSVGSILKAITHCDVLHLHISNPKALFVFTLWGRLIGKTVIVTLHGNYGRFVSLNKKLIQSVIKNASVPVVINENSFDACKKINKQTILLSAFIPPQKEENLNEEVQSVIADAKARGKQIVSTNAFNISYDKDGNETYGIGFLLDFFENSDFTFLFSDPTGNYRKQYSNDYKNTLFITQPHSK